MEGNFTEGRGEQNRKTTSNPTDANSVLSPLLMTTDLNKKKNAVFCVATLFLIRSSSADAAFEYAIWLSGPQPFPVYFPSAFGKNVENA